MEYYPVQISLPQEQGMMIVGTDYATIYEAGDIDLD
jgi:hypothetical protein